MLEPGKDGQLTSDIFMDDIPFVTSLLFSADGTTLYYAYEVEDGDGLVSAIWRCSTRPLPGPWPPACMWDSPRAANLAESSPSTSR